MIDLYTWTTPNGRKVSIMLEECGLEYAVCPVDLGKGEQFSPAFSRISPGNLIPVIVDRDAGVTLVESGAILLYLAEKSGRFLPGSRDGYWQVLQWLMFQVGNIGPTFGQAHHFLHYHPGVSSYSSERYAGATRRYYAVLDRRLGETEFLGGGEYTIADIATWPWVSRFEWHRVDLDEFPHVKRWYVQIAARPAVQRGYQQPHKVNELPMP